MLDQPPLSRPHRELRLMVEAVADAAEGERQLYRGRKRQRGDRGRSFWEDPDRFALAFMVSVQLAGEHTAIRFGTRRSAWAAALHAAALVAPGRGQRVLYTHRIVDGVLLAKAVFKAGPDRHANAAARLGRKLRGLSDLPETWVYLSGSLLSTLNSGTSEAARARSQALLSLLGWRAIPRAVWVRLAQLAVPSSDNGLADLLSNDGPPRCADNRGHSQSTASARAEHDQARPPPEHRRRHPGTPGPRPHQGACPR